MPGLPGAAQSLVSFCDCASFHASACSRPPLPSKRMFMSTSSQYDPSGRLLAEDVAGDNAPAFSITEISAMLKRTVADRFGYVKLRGEISGFKRAASGHLYLCLKDENAVIDGVMWRGGEQRLAFRPEYGKATRLNSSH